MGKFRPCPRGLEDSCPIPRELCLEEYERTGQWQCEKLLAEFEWFVFGEEDDPDWPWSRFGGHPTEVEG
ncbi:MAG: hypothetical protein DRQ08_07285 [Candidatus Latescibacterota bacterium]|nr:MAG: hypothetical protein DRQ08_07285 [Candidatus Latescibacterota bacterium]